MNKLEYHHVDVFAARPFCGNSLTVFVNAGSLLGSQMLRITQEMRHFESIFLSSAGTPNTYQAQVFDLAGELDFAGHPLLGAGCVLHSRFSTEQRVVWTFLLRTKTVNVVTDRREDAFRAVLDQGRPEFLGEVPSIRRKEFAAALNLEVDQLSMNFPLEVVSTGLRYLIVPIETDLDRARIVRADFAELLRTVNAQFAYVLGVRELEGRHWSNDGVMEDIATGSGAGTVGAYLTKHRRVAVGEEFLLRQGRFSGRPSEIRVRSEGTPSEITRVEVGGDVALVSRGVLNALPEVKE
jgi:trans-2,3-dihydro-3-hydroxyanthranilate isomerase